MTEIFRQARPDEVLEIARLLAHSFPASGGVAAQEKLLTEGPHGGIETLWVGDEGRRIVAACQLLSMKQWIAGVAIPIMGLGSVAIAPTHRRRGLAGRLLSSAFVHARERGDVASALYPFRAAYYQRMGYGEAGVAHQYLIPPDALPDDPEERARVQLADNDADEAAMRSVYEAGIRDQTGQIERGERSWSAAWVGAGGAAVLYRSASGEPEGYAIIRYRPDLPPQERYLEVVERMWLTSAAQRGIYAWLASLGDQWPLLLYRAHPEEGFADRLREPRLPQGSAPGWNLWYPSATILRGPMFRILDLEAAFRKRRVNRADPITLAIEVADDQIPQNSGDWRLRIGDGGIEVERGPATAGDVHLSLSISTLSRIFIGSLSPSSAVMAGLAVTDDLGRLPALDAIFRVSAPWTFDRF